jgi:hypothetical protein
VQASSPLVHRSLVPLPEVLFQRWWGWVVVGSTAVILPFTGPNTRINSPPSSIGNFGFAFSISACYQDFTGACTYVNWILLWFRVEGVRGLREAALHNVHGGIDRTTGPTTGSHALHASDFDSCTSQQALQLRNESGADYPRGGFPAHILCC